MGVDIFSINLDKPSRQYSPGENIHGKVFIRISEVETTSEISIRFFGAANTHWREREHHRHTVTKFGKQTTETEVVYYDYYGHDILFDFAVRLFGDGDNRVQIPVGDNVFPFTFQVPLRPLPVTCSFEDGHVVYGLEGRIRKPWYSSDPKTEILPVTLWTMVDLNLTPGAANPMQVTDTKSFGSCCCRTNPCLMNSLTPKVGYCTGEVVPFVVEFQNQSDRPILNITATLTQVWTLSAYGHRGLRIRTHPVALQAAGHNGVGPGQIIKWEVAFTVPPTVPPTPAPNACDIVKMEYLINVNAAVEGCCGDASFGISHPIIVGTIPLVVTPSALLQQQQIPQYNNEKGGLV